MSGDAHEEESDVCCCGRSWSRRSRIARQAVAISAVGLDASTGVNWRNPSVSKPLDIDGNNTYGSAGYIAFATGPQNVGLNTGGNFAFAAQQRDAVRFDAGLGIDRVDRTE